MKIKKIITNLLFLGIVFIVVALNLFIFWRVRLANRVGKQLNAITSAQQPVTLQELDAWYTAVPDEKNAAKEIEASFALVRDYGDKRSNEISHFKPPVRGESLTADQTALLAGYVEMNREAMAKVREALTRPASRYSVDFTWGYNTPLAHLPKVKKLTVLAQFEALLAVSTGEPSNVVVSIQTELELARTLEEEPSLISQLVRLACINIAAGSAEHALAKMEFNKHESEELDSAFSAVDRTGTMVRGFIGDRAMYLPAFRMSRAEIGRMSDDNKDDSGSNKPPTGPLVQGHQPIFMRVNGFFERDLSFFLQAMETNIGCAKLPPPESLKLNEIAYKNSETAKNHLFILSGLSLPAMSKMTEKEARALANVRLTRTALAIERFRQATGKLPDELKQLTPQFLPTVPIDPFDGMPLRYRKREHWHLVYSVGMDGQDDNGKEKPEKSSGLGPENYDLTFVVDR